MFNKTFRRRKSFSNTFTLSPRNLNSTISHIETIVFRIICALVTKSLIAKLQYPIIFIYFCHAQAITTSFRYILRETSLKKKKIANKKVQHRIHQNLIYLLLSTLQNQRQKLISFSVDWLNIDYQLANLFCKLQYVRLENLIIEQMERPNNYQKFTGNLLCISFFSDKIQSVIQSKIVDSPILWVFFQFDKFFSTSDSP